MIRRRTSVKTKVIKKKKIQQSCSIVCLVSCHFVEGLLEFDADFSVFVLPVGEIGDEKIQLLLQLGSLTLGGGSLNLGELEVHRQISDFFLGILVAFESVGLRQLKSLHVLADNVELFLQISDRLLSFLALVSGTIEVDLGHGKFSGDLLSVSSGLEGDVTGDGDVFLEGVHALVIDEGLGLEDLALNLHGFRGLGGLGELGALNLKSAFRSGDVVIKKGGSTLEGGDFLLIDQLLLLSFLQTKSGSLQLLSGVVEGILNLHDLFANDNDLVIALLENLVELSDAVLKALL